MRQYSQSLAQTARRVCDGGVAVLGMNEGNDALLYEASRAD